MENFDTRRSPVQTARNNLNYLRSKLTTFPRRKALLANHTHRWLELLRI
ncbi:hypothetical protein [Microcoleus sp. S36bC1]